MSVMTTCGLNRVELLDRFRRGVEGKNLMPFIAAERHNDLHHRRFVVYNDDLGHSLQGGEYFKLRKEKQKRESESSSGGIE